MKMKEVVKEVQLFNEFPTVSLCSYRVYVVPSKNPDFCLVSAMLGYCSEAADTESDILV